MAHQTKNGVGASYRPRAITERPELAALLGATAAEWSRLDYDITFLYAQLMGAYLPSFEGFSKPLHPVALQVFDTLETQYQRINLLTKLANWVIKDETLLAELLAEIIPSIQAAAKLRNTLVHANWAIADEYPDGLINNPVFGHHMVYKATDFEEALDRITNASKAVRELTMKFNKLHEKGNTA